MIISKFDFIHPFSTESETVLNTGILMQAPFPTPHALLFITITLQRLLVSRLNIYNV